MLENRKICQNSQQLFSILKQQTSNARNKIKSTQNQKYSTARVQCALTFSWKKIKLVATEEKDFVSHDETKLKIHLESSIYQNSYPSNTENDW